ncbi:MAG: energy transducer TonB [Parvibaculum sp.]|nr:energy transducer TonB [Parvibaculum sp.]
MNGVAQDIATQDGQDGSSSVMSFRSRGLQMSMATSFAAHAALGFFIIAMMPERSISFGGPATDAVVMVDMAPSTPASKPVVTNPDTKAAEFQTPVVKLDVPKPEPLPVIEKAEAVFKPASASVEQKTVRETLPQLADSDLPVHTTPVFYAAQKVGARPAPLAKQGEDAEDELIITSPRYREKPKPPVYPKRAKDLGQHGIVFVRARLDFEGNAEEVMVLKSSGHVLLDNSAMAAVRRWHFEPGRRNGTPVVAWVHVPVRFTLN